MDRGLPLRLSKGVVLRNRVGFLLVILMGTSVLGFFAFQERPLSAAAEQAQVVKAQRVKAAAPQAQVNPAAQSSTDSQLPTQPVAPLNEAEGLYARGAERLQAGDAVAAANIFIDLVRRFPSDEAAGRAGVQLALMYKASGDMASERNALSVALHALPEGTVREQAAEELDRVNGELIFSKKATADSVTYVVKSGDSLERIAKRYKVTAPFLKRINYLQSNKLVVGDKLKVFQGPFDIVIDKSKYRLTLYLKGVIVKEYKVGLGKNSSTPEGEYAVRNKLVDPEWNPPGPEYAASKAPDNPLGTRWIGFNHDYGIHGTIDPQSIGKSESRGCVRLLNQDAEEVYDLVIIGSKVTVRP